MPRIQIASDLHLEMLERFQDARLVEPAPGADILVLAGDIHNKAKAVAAFRDWPVPVVLVAGNHEPYGAFLDQTRVDIADSCAAARNITFLDNSAVEIGSVRLLGSTLWTDFQLRGHSRETWMKEVGRGLMDYELISTQEGKLTPAYTLNEHVQSRRWLERELAKDFDGCTVVVTHHAPHPLSIHPQYIGNRLNAGFASDLTPLLFKADLWIHGHMHTSSDYSVGGCRVVANPAGYVLNLRRAKTAAEFKLENPEFDPFLVIDTDGLQRAEHGLA